MRSVPPVLARLAIALTFAAAHAAAAAMPLAVPLALQETAGVERRAWPASASVPLPRGRLAAPDAVWLAADERRPVPFQARALERWPDGSVRWLLLDFLADVPAGGLATYTLHDGRPPRPSGGPTVRVRQGPDGARVLDTGALRVTLPARGTALLTDLSVGGARLPGPVALPALAVASVPGGPPTRDRLTVETEGPVRSELVATGRYPQGITWEVRVAAFAGQRFLRLEHTVTNMADPHYAPVRSLLLTVPGKFASAQVGVDGHARSIGALDGRRLHELVHDDAAPALLDGKGAGRHADGWVRALGGGNAVTLVVPAFWQEYPKAFRARADGLAIDLFDGERSPLQFGTGAAKTHELWIAVAPADTATDPGELASALAAPLVALPPASWMVTSRALPQALDPAAPGAREFLARLTAAYGRYRDRERTERWDDGPPVPCEQRTEEHPRIGLYGLFNWGDWQFPGYRDRARGCDGWGNLEYDLTQVLGLAWAATGSEAFFQGFVPAARHYRDVDVIHHAPGHPDWVGLNHPHKALHFAFESPETIDLGHTWTEGLVTYHRLTGDVRALEAARGIADALVGREKRARNPRQYGWPMIALGAVYDATGQRRYLDAARAYADGAMKTYRPTPAAGDWKMGILADGLAVVHAATGDESIQSWLVAYTDTLLAGGSRWADPRFALPVGYMAALTGDLRYERAALRTVHDMKIGDWGKTLASTGRVGFRVLGPLAAGHTSGGETRTRARRTAAGDGQRLLPASDPAAALLFTGRRADGDDRHGRDEVLARLR
jgi:hypothetical protein